VDDPALAALILREYAAVEVLAVDRNTVIDTTPVDIGPGRVVEYVGDGAFVDLDFACGLTFLPRRVVYEMHPSFVIFAGWMGRVRW
jgi:hypothetical protein